jgi:hypothetical protein
VARARNHGLHGASASEAIRLRQAQSVEFKVLAMLFEQYLEYMRTPNLAMESPRPSNKHVLDGLSRDAKHILTKPYRPAREESNRNGWFRFRNLHPALVPHDWCLQLFKPVLDTYPLDGDVFLRRLSQDLHRVKDGIELVYEHRTSKGEANRPFYSFSAPASYQNESWTWETFMHRREVFGARGIPSPKAEIL